VKKITVENYSDFLEMALNQKFTFSQGIVETILDNINTRKKQIPVFEIEVDSEGATYTLSVEKDEFIHILKTNLIHFENEEAYEGC
jgi:hypothetical protein